LLLYHSPESKEERVLRQGKSLPKGRAAMEGSMDQSSYKQALERLRQVGCTESEIEQLCQLRKASLEQELDQVTADLRRLEFVRWLVTTGRLTEQLDTHELPVAARRTPVPPTS
jgi:hypothetical protein